MLELLDETRTGAGAQLVAQMDSATAALSKERIERRLDAVAELRDNLLVAPRLSRDYAQKRGRHRAFGFAQRFGDGQRTRFGFAAKTRCKLCPRLKVALTEARAGALTQR